MIYQEGGNRIIEDIGINHAGDLTNTVPLTLKQAAEGTGIMLGTAIHESFLH
jgi:ribosomal protein S5